MIELREIRRRELILALIQHRMGFMPIFLKYRDKNNPVFRTYFDFTRYYKSPKLTMLWKRYLTVYTKKSVIKLFAVVIL